MSEKNDLSHSAEEETKPPLFGSWNGWYIFVLGSLVLYIILFDWFTRSFQ